jgi:hypothetical protein
MGKNDPTFGRETPMTPPYLSEMWIVLSLLLMQPADQFGAARAAESPQAIRIGAPLGKSRVPAPLRQGTVLPPQSVSALDVSDDGRFLAVGTMAFRHDRNFWLLSAETGEVAWGRYVETWAPAQVAQQAITVNHPIQSDNEWSPFLRDNEAAPDEQFPRRIPWPSPRRRSRTQSQ